MRWVRVRCRCGGKVFVNEFMYVWVKAEDVFGDDVESCWNAMKKHHPENCYYGEQPNV